jgi:membrane protease YdiL (CAAX protease family)
LCALLEPSADQYSQMMNRKLTIVRVLFFCLLCAIVLATTSRLTKNLPTEWKQHLSLTAAIVITYGLTIAFTKWEKLQLRNVGVIATKATFRKVAFGLGIGLFMTSVQPLFVLLLGHYTITFNASISFYTIFFYLTLYILVAIREELAFRGYPLFSLNYRFGLWTSQLIILVVFSLEHIIGGMTWIEAFLGAGTGALLFGLAAIRTNGIALPIGLHTAWNFGQWCFGFKKEAGFLNGIAKKGFENVVERNAWISYLLIMTIAIVVLYFYQPKNTSAALK